jgi:hypothetical protein
LGRKRSAIFWLRKEDVRLLYASCYVRNNTLTIEPDEAPGIATQIAVALAGFAGVVVVFRREAVREWSDIDKLRLRLLLGDSILPLALSMLGLLPSPA